MMTNKRPIRSYLDDECRIKAHIALSDHPLVLAPVKPGGVVIDILDVDDEVCGGLLAPTISGSVGQAECLPLLKIKTSLSPGNNLIVSSTRSHNHLEKSNIYFFEILDFEAKKHFEQKHFTEEQNFKNLYGCLHRDVIHEQLFKRKIVSSPRLSVAAH